MYQLTPNTILKRQARIEIELGATLELKVSVNGRSTFYREHSLAILEIFARPMTVREAVKKLRARGHQDWIDLTSTINKLHGAGVLVEDAGDSDLDLSDSGFDAPAVHISMLNDRCRTESFLRAIAATVRPGDVVVDIGTGTGILAVAAARAGAAHVYAVEAGTMADIAQSVFAASDVADKLTLIRGWSTQIELPQKADVLVSEIIGRDPFEERVLQVTADARRRLLKPNARLVPTKVRAYGVAVTVPASKVDDLCFSPEAIGNWQSWYGIDFRPLAKLSRDSVFPSLAVRSRQAAGWPALSDPILLADVDLRDFQEPAFAQVQKVEIVQGGLLNGLLMFFELEVGATTITTHPIKTTPTNSWANPVWLFSEARLVRAGDQITIQFNYNTSANSSEVRLLG